MKGITYCGACADYDIKKHHCKRGAKMESNPQDKFFDDCPLPDAVPVRRGKWNIRVSDERTLCLECSVCGRRVDDFNLHRLLIFGEYGQACRRYPYCHCGAKMCLEEDTYEM